MHPADRPLVTESLSQIIRIEAPAQLGTYGDEIVLRKFVLPVFDKFADRGILPHRLQESKRLFFTHACSLLKHE